MNFMYEIRLRYILSHTHTHTQNRNIIFIFRVRKSIVWVYNILRVLDFFFQFFAFSLTEKIHGHSQFVLVQWKP